MKTSPATVQKIAETEALRLEAYNDATGNATIGYGHLIHLGKLNGTEGEFTKPITKERALELLAEDIGWAEAAVSHFIRVPLNQNQFDALVSFTYNTGSGTLFKSPLRRLLNDRQDYASVPAHLSLYVFSQGKKIPGLVTRRAWEAALFAKPV